MSCYNMRKIEQKIDSEQRGMKPTDVFVRCFWHAPNGAIVRRKDGARVFGRLKDRLEELLPQTHGCCAACKVRMDEGCE